MESGTLKISVKTVGAYLPLVGILLGILLLCLLVYLIKKFGIVWAALIFFLIAILFLVVLAILSRD